MRSHGIWLKQWAVLPKHLMRSQNFKKLSKKNSKSQFLETCQKLWRKQARISLNPESWSSSIVAHILSTTSKKQNRTRRCLHLESNLRRISKRRNDTFKRGKSDFFCNEMCQSGVVCPQSVPKNSKRTRTKFLLIKSVLSATCWLQTQSFCKT